MTAKPEPIEFPPPSDPVTADRIETTAEQIQAEYPDRTLLECRQLAEQLVYAIECWEVAS